MREEKSYFDRVVRSGGTTIRVRLRPRGSELRDLTEGVGVVTWVSALPGLLSILGWVLHHTVYRRQWLVTATPDVARDGMRALRLEPGRKREAEQVYLRLVDWLADGHELDDFPTEAP